ncbi:uncharacterized protein VTP21DRAFT_9528 [Calcarisporiella thermophila]|uniref:uncharacterized protein n=1 Tax=Calcarisporiella thermophila TaxID=911321 RepID=UPI003743CCEF
MPVSPYIASPRCTAGVLALPPPLPVRGLASGGGPACSLNDANPARTRFVAKAARARRPLARGNFSFFMSAAGDGRVEEKAALTTGQFMRHRRLVSDALAPFLILPPAALSPPRTRASPPLAA